MEDTIYLKEVLNQMKTPDKEGLAVPFSIKARTYQRFSKTGGRMLSYETAKLVMQETVKDRNSISSLMTKSKSRPSHRKSPGHFENKTRNIRVLPSGDIKKINILFITEFNGKKVIY